MSGNDGVLFLPHIQRCFYEAILRDHATQTGGAIFTKWHFLGGLAVSIVLHLSVAFAFSSFAATPAKKGTEEEGALLGPVVQWLRKCERTERTPPSYVMGKRSAENTSAALSEKRVAVLGLFDGTQNGGKCPANEPIVAIMPPQTLSDTSEESALQDAVERKKNKNHNPRPPYTPYIADAPYPACPAAGEYLHPQTCSAPENRFQRKNHRPRDFDVLTPQGRALWKRHILATLQGRTLLPLNGVLRYCDLARYDDHNRPYRRVFVPGRGWTAKGQLEQEMELYGHLALVRRAPLEQGQ